jgi:hypothetical protein
MPTEVTPERFQAVLASLPSKYSQGCESEGCNCEIAQAIYLALTERGIESKLRVCFRTEESGNDTPVTTFSHVVVNALDTNWDESGTEAKSRWEAQWAARSEAHHRFMWKAIKGEDALTQLADLRRTFVLDDTYPKRIEEIKQDILRGLA